MGMENDMTKRIPTGFAKLVAVALIATGCLAIAAGAASAATPQVAYNNLNTVPVTVNGFPNTDTYSEDYEFFPMGNQIETVATLGRRVKSLATQLDSFTCEFGVYELENCHTLKPNKTFKMTWTATIYTVGLGNVVGTPIASSTATFKIHFRPTTNVSCPATSEGKGYGPNCDVGGFLQPVTFKHFTTTAPLPAKVIILLTNSCGGCEGKPVNAGLQAAYKEFNGTNFVAEPPLNGGNPEIGSDPLGSEMSYENATLKSRPAGFLPVFKLTLY